MKFSEFIWMNGELVPWQNATVHVMSHALHYGTSVFEGIRSYATPGGAAIFRLEAHLKRLFDSAKVYRMNVSYSLDELRDACFLAVAKNKLTSSYIRPLIFRGFSSIGVVPPLNAPVEVAVAAFEIDAYLGREGMENGIDACVSSWHRTNSSTNPILAKAGGHYLNAFLIGAEARQHGYGEGISVSTTGLVAEGAAENVFVIRNGKIFTPPLAAAILGGITRDSVVHLARDLGYEVIEENLPRELLYTCDELFMTGTAAEVTPIRSVDRLPVADGKPGPITKAIQSAFFGLFDGSTTDRYGWLDDVPQNLYP
ncbi:MAG: branched-chain amino acid transaminase [Pirellulaceae bacterium]|jgi:branched-chain amino acid aminotransferase|nr:branched-chain amino acid transaminase [Pirellulaceae bacterium]